ncbi:MAG: hypothetical protein ACSHYB_05095 [Roseibacillus sp.]
MNLRIDQEPQSLNKLRRVEPLGFALVATITLMILLSLIAVGILSLSATSLRKSGPESDLITARSNARLSVMIAISQLQKTLGPDQRASATADLTVPNGFAKWTGAYGNEEVADYSQAPSAIPASPYKPVLLNWLVSGNETVNFESSTDATDFGKITTPPSSVPYSPTDSSPGLGSGNSLLTINDTRAALLVGGGSTDSSANTTSLVAAPIVEIKDSQDTAVKGGYAYWIGDEGVKARIDLRDNFRQQTNSGDIDEAKSFSFLTSQRSGIETMRRDDNSTSKIGEDYDPDNNGLEKLASTGEFPLLFKNLTTVAKRRYHDLTAYSKSVIADSYAGGLKQEMGALIYGNAGPGDSEPIFTPENASDFGLPTWGHLRSWAKLTAPHATPPPILSSSGARPYTQNQSRFGPVILVAQLAFGVEQVPGTTDELRILLFPALVLWNPYTVGIPSSDFEIGYRFIPNDSAEGTMRVQMNSRGSSSPRADPWQEIGSCDLTGGDAQLTSGDGFFRFQVQGSEIPAGESHIYLIDSSGSSYEPGNTKLVRAPDRAPIGHLTRAVYTSTSFTFDQTAFFAGPYVKLDCDLGLSQGMANGNRFEVVLTDPGELASGFTKDTPVYQALLDMNFYPRSADVVAAKQLSLADLQAMYFMRSQIMMEARGGFAADWSRVGAMNSNGRGERNRWIASQNPTAPYIKRTANEESLRGGAFSHGNVISGENDNTRHMLGMASTNNHLAGIGGDPSPGASASLIDVLPSELPLMSLGQFQHAQLDPYGFGMTYTFGNGAANVNIPRTQQYESGQVAPPGNAPTRYSDTLYDMSWHTNRALWDRYFVSTAQPSLTQSDIDNNLPLPNARMEFVRGSRNNPTPSNFLPKSPQALLESAANLMVKGGFNLNSTSVDAWRAILTGTNQLTVPSSLANPQYSSNPLNAMIPRFSRDVRKSDATNTDGLTNMWSASNARTNMYRGNRELLLFRENGKTNESISDAQERLHEVADELAEKIVAEIRLRGPFLSISDFANRKLVNEDEGIRGTLQAALDKMESNKVNPEASFSQIGAFVNTDTKNNAVPGWDGEHYMGTPSSERGSSSNSRTAMAPKHLTQADILSTIGPFLSARSDTFTIRGYGESLDASGNIVAQAWCEAIVQRQPDYVDPADDAWVSPQNLTQSVNKTFGRRFSVVAFRWLSEKEI